MQLIPLPAFNGNYIWMLRGGHQSLVDDPSDAQPVLAALHHFGVMLKAILVTRHDPARAGRVGVWRKASGAVVTAGAP